MLFGQWMTPSPTSGQSPAELLMSWCLTTLLNRLHPDRVFDQWQPSEGQDALRGFFPGNQHMPGTMLVVLHGSQFELSELLAPSPTRSQQTMVSSYGGASTSCGDTCCCSPYVNHPDLPSPSPVADLPAEEPALHEDNWTSQLAPPVLQQPPVESQSMAGATGGYTRYGVTTSGAPVLSETITSLAPPSSCLLNPGI